MMREQGYVRRSMRRTPKIVVVASHPGQYQTPWFRELSRVFDLRVFYAHRQSSKQQADAGYRVAFEWDIDLLSGYENHFMSNVAADPGVHRFGGCDTPEIASIVAKGDLDAVIVSGWHLKSYWQTIMACRRSRVPVLVRGDSQLGTSRPALWRLAKEVAYRGLMRQFDAFLCVGERNREYLLHYGVPRERIFPAPHFVDNAFFASRSRMEPAERAALREDIGLAENEIGLLFVGRFVDFKRPTDLLRAARVLLDRGRRVRPLYVGAGPLEAALRAFAREQGVEMTLLGFRNQTELPKIYASCDLLVLPSTAQETWGLVVNEAMACGCPAVVSTAAGCSPDMIRVGQTGATYSTGDAQALAAAIESLLPRLKSPATQRALRDVLAYHSCQTAVAGTLEAVRYTLSR